MSRPDDVAASPRALTMQDRLLAAAHMESLAHRDRTLRVIADTVIDCVRCCGEFPECSHVLAEGERVDAEEGQVKSAAWPHDWLPPCLTVNPAGSPKIRPTL